MQREFTSLRIPVPAHSWESARHKTEEKIVLAAMFFSRKKGQYGYKIMHFHTKFISSLVLQAVLAY